MPMLIIHETAWIIMGGIDKAPQALLKLMNFENPCACCFIEIKQAICVFSTLEQIVAFSQLPR